MASGAHPSGNSCAQARKKMGSKKTACCRANIAALGVLPPLWLTLSCIVADMRCVALARRSRLSVSVCRRAMAQSQCSCGSSGGVSADHHKFTGKVFLPAPVSQNLFFFSVISRKTQLHPEKKKKKNRPVVAPGRPGFRGRQ